MSVAIPGLWTPPRPRIWTRPKWLDRICERCMSALHGSAKCKCCGPCGVNAGTRALLVDGSSIIVAGTFTEVGKGTASGGAAIRGIARYDGSWSAIGTGTGAGANNNVIALCWYGSDLVAAGAFTSIDGVSANRVAKWNGSTWSALGTGTSGLVNWVGTFGGDLIAFGSFVTAGGVTCNGAARWDGSSWNAMGSGFGLVSGAPFAGLDHGGLLWAGGAFGNAGGVSNTQCLATWDGSAWASNGATFTATGTPSIVGFEPLGSDLAMIGDFTSLNHSAGNLTTDALAVWDGSAWYNLGGAFASPAIGRGLTTWGGDLVAGFTGSGVPQVQRWNGSSWDDLGAGSSNSFTPFAFAEWGSDLAMAGTLTTVAGVTTAHTARYNGTVWSCL